VVEGAAARGADVTVLRLVRAEPDPDDPFGMGGAVTYVAELHGSVPDGLRPTSESLDDHPLRLPWAQVGGPARELAWAEQVLAECGRERTGPPHQMRAWNLSSIWTIPTNVGPVWLKSVPPFFAHEGAIIERLAAPELPPLLGSTAGRVLMADIAGTDQYDAALPTLEHAVAALVSIQHRVTDQVDELLALGLADWRWPALRVRIDDVAVRHRHELDRAEQRALDRLVGTLDRRCADIDACGLPMALVHGDFHPGNLRGDDAHLFILDWGDCGVGHPLFDVAAMMERLDPAWCTSLMATWARAWRGHRPASDPLRAATLIEPVAALRQAVIYRGFLDGIEPSERCFHAADPARWLRRAARSVKNNQS
jgi:Ser/Thr protein kinase RdoA (MazF antagonist)